MMPRPEKLSRINAATSMLLISCAHRSVAGVIPPEPWTRITVASLSVPGLGIRSSPASIVGLPLLSPMRNCLVLSVIVSIGRISQRAWASVGPDVPARTNPIPAPPLHFENKFDIVRSAFIGCLPLVLAALSSLSRQQRLFFASLLGRNVDGDFADRRAVHLGVESDRDVTPFKGADVGILPHTGHARALSLR